LLFVLVYLPKGYEEPPKFYIVSSVELMKKREEYKDHIESTSGKYDDKMGGINWATAFDYEDRWDT